MRPIPPKVYRFTVCNFKSIGEPGVDLELKPFTLLFGSQGVGKSNILEVLWRFAKLLYQTIRGSTSSELTGLARIEPKYRSERSIFHKEDLNRPLRLGVHVIVEDGKIGGWIIECRWKYEKNTLETLQEVVLEGKTVLRVGSVAKEQGVRENVVLIPENLDKESVYVPFPYEVKPNAFRLEARSGKTISKELEERSRLAQQIASIVANRLIGRYTVKVAFLSAFRGVVSDEVSTAESVESEGEVYPLKPDGSNLIHYLSFIRESARYTVFRGFIEKWAEELGLASLKAGFRGRNTLSADFHDKILDVSPNLAYASHGSKQALCVIAQLFSPTQDIILVEEPEISLHPESVAKLPLMFLDAIRLGKQVIASTHSTILPLALSRMVKKAKEEGLCEDPNELIAVYEIEKDAEGTKAKRLLLDDRGYIKDYVPSFFKVEEELLKEWEEGLPETPS